jgi:hypothetical protein
MVATLLSASGDRQTDGWLKPKTILIDNLIRENFHEPQDHGFMYQHGFQDLDNHLWEIFFMESSTT